MSYFYWYNLRSWNLQQLKVYSIISYSDQLLASIDCLFCNALMESFANNSVHIKSLKIRLKMCRWNALVELTAVILSPSADQRIVVDFGGFPHVWVSTSVLPSHSIVVWTKDLFRQINHYPKNKILQNTILMISSNLRSFEIMSTKIEYLTRLILGVSADKKDSSGMGPWRAAHPSFSTP